MRIEITEAAMELGAEVGGNNLLSYTIFLTFSSYKFIPVCVWPEPILCLCVLFSMQKLSLLVTEAYKDAHQKSVLVKLVILFWGPLLCYLIDTNIGVVFRLSGHEGENEQSCPKFRNATSPQWGAEMIMICFGFKIRSYLTF